MNPKVKKRLCCPPLQAEVDIYDGLFDDGIMTERQQIAYNAMVEKTLHELADGRAKILANP